MDRHKHEMPARHIVAAFAALVLISGLLLTPRAETLGALYKLKKFGVFGCQSSVFVGAASPHTRRRITKDSQVFQWSRELNALDEAPSMSASPVSSPHPETISPSSATPTMSPSRQPSPAPSDASTKPTAKPTVQPTMFPVTLEPTSKPSNMPSQPPSASPITSEPTPAPSKEPSKLPTFIPTKQPTGKPTFSPTRSPSLTPTSMPSDKPTPKPSIKPTGKPTSAPSKPPTVNPSISPTDNPTRRPSRQPTHQPSNRPTTKPSSLPTASPSSIPTSKPSNSPSTNPTQSPSKNPTQRPSNRPTFKPSRRPTAHPTNPPTNMPSHRPTDHPTESPSRKPTRHPTQGPTSKPSFEPSNSPSTNPTLTPSKNPTQRPSNRPTFKPSRRPTAHPTNSPTNMPSRRPTDHPTESPSHMRTRRPTQRPTSKPSFEPSGLPTALPTVTPSKIPTQRPSALPSTFPITDKPTSEPTDAPTGSPETAQPISPSKKLTLEPAPSASLITPSPSYFPTETATFGSTMEPSHQPSKPSFVVMNAALSFNLPLSKPMTDNSLVNSFEDTIERFLEQKLSGSDGLSITNYNVTIVSQDVKLGVQIEARVWAYSPTSDRRNLEESARNEYLLVTTSLTAIGTPAHLASNYPFQAKVHSAVSENSEDIYDELHASTLKQLQDVPPTERNVGLSTSDDGKLKTIALGSSVAGAFVLVSLLAVLIVHRRHENARSSDANNEDPPAKYASAFGKSDEDISSIGDSLLSAGQVHANYPKNIPHYDQEEQVDLSNWSLDDVQPGEVTEQENSTDPHYVNTKNGNDETSSYAGSLKKDAFMSIGDETSSYAGSLKKDAFISMGQAKTAADSNRSNIDEKVVTTSQDKLEELDPTLMRLYDKAMLEEDEVSYEGPKDVVPQARKPSQGFKMFSCFADNTFEDNQGLTAKKILQDQYRSTRMSNAAKTRIYEVAVQPGPLGIVIDSTSQGPFVHEIKSKSPLNGLVEKGDMIVSIDGWNCEKKNAGDVARWIKIKRNKGQQVLVMKGKALDNAAYEYGDEGSV